ncbi:hypothetical protein [Massilia sp. GCM10023247]|uniref:hypothetical protein n=1 Tax=Massilia sp. GCM10023247 TaxID=3252643 RepID=UPI00360F2ECF
MTPREITSAMHRLFQHETGGNEPWRHLMKDGALDRGLCDRLLEDYISDNEVVVFADPRHALQCKRIDASRYIDEFMKLGYVKIANLTFSSKVVIAPIGVGQGFSKRSLPLSST